MWLYLYRIWQAICDYDHVLNDGDYRDVPYAYETFWGFLVGCLHSWRREMWKMPSLHSGTMCGWLVALVSLDMEHGQRKH